MLEFWEAGLQFLVYLAICELHLSPPALSEMGSRMIWKTKHFALCTMQYALCTLHYALWNTRALAYDLENCRNFAAIPTPSELGDPSVWERDRPSFSSPTPVESLCPVSLFGAIRKIFSQTPSFSSSHTYKAQFWTDLIFWSTSYPQKITSHTYQGAEFLQIPLFGAPQYVDIF